MSEAQAHSRQELEYIVRMLQMNPAQEGDEIMRARVSALGLDKHRAGDRAALREGQQADRRQLLHELESVRAKFWSLPLDELTAKIGALNSHGFDDFEAAIARLRVVAANRAGFPPLAGKRGFDEQFFSSLKEVLIRSPRDTVVIRDRVLSTFRDKAQRKSGRRMIALLKAEMPVIYQLEAEWFEALLRQKAAPTTVPVVRSNSVSANSFREGVRSYWWVLLVISGVLRGALGISNLNDRNSRGPAITPYSQDDAVRTLRDLRQPEINLREYVRDKERERENASRAPTMEANKEVWSPYPDSSVPQSSGDLQNSFPKVFDINPPPSSSRPDDRFPK